MFAESFKVLRQRASLVRHASGVASNPLKQAGAPLLSKQSNMVMQQSTRHKAAAVFAAAHKASNPTNPQLERSGTFLDQMLVDTNAETVFQDYNAVSDVLRGGKSVSAVIEKSQIVSCKPVNEGKQLELTFADETSYRLHAAWVKDSSPAMAGKDYYRKSAADVWALGEFRIAGAQATQNGQSLSLEYTTSDGSVFKDELNAKFLHSFAPFVGKALHMAAPPRVARGTSNLWDELQATRKSWKCDCEVPQFDAKSLEHDLDKQTAFIEAMVSTGVAQINGLGQPESLEKNGCGKPLEDLVFKMVGRFNQHPVRETRYGVIRKLATNQYNSSGDYNMNNPLSMHTDHTVYHGTPGFLQFLYQAEGHCRSKVVDGIALAEYFRENFPDQYKLLTEVHITHSSRNNLYTIDGKSRNIKDPTQKGFPFELVHTHPVIELNADGRVEKVVQSETKRGVSAVSYDEYEPFMEAYEHWVQMCEDDRFIKHFDWPEGTVLVTNNWQVMHGRASVPPEMKRTMVFAYLSKVNVENRYRYLKQCEAERDNKNIDSTWMTRVPNQVLASMVS